MKNIKTFSSLIAFVALFSHSPKLYSQTTNNVTAKSETNKQITMKEYVLLIRLPLNYGPTEALAVREKWNTLTDKWKADNIFVTSFIFPVEGYVISGTDKLAKKESVISNDSRMISTIIVRAATIEDALLLAKACPVLEQAGTVEVREIQPRPLSGVTNLLTTSTSIETRNKETIRNLYENILNNSKTELLNDLISPDYTGMGGIKGVAGFSSTVLSVKAGFPDIKWTIDDMIAEGDKVTVRWHWVGTNSAPYAGIPASNKSVTNNAITIHQLKDGKLINTWIQGDRLGVLMQIGVIPIDMVPISPIQERK